MASTNMPAAHKFTVGVFLKGGSGHKVEGENRVPLTKRDEENGTTTKNKRSADPALDAGLTMASDENGLSPQGLRQESRLIKVVYSQVV